jgi:hypothetical protein
MLGAPGRRSVHDQYAKAERPAPLHENWPTGQL